MTAPLRVIGLYVVSLILAGSAVVSLAQQRVDPFVFGGAPVQQGALPFVVALLKPGGPAIHCGAVLVDSGWVLTAGHCVQPDALWRTLIVKAGSVELDQSSPSSTISIVRLAKDFRRNPSMPPDSDVFFEDLAVVKLESSFRVDGRNIRTIELVSKEDEETLLLYSSNPKQVAGWGVMNGAAHSNTLRTSVVQPLALDRCRAIRGEGNVTDRMMCAGNAKTNHCLGDSGGPYFASSKLLGIISWGDVCGLDKPGVHTRVSAYAEWVWCVIRGHC